MTDAHYLSSHDIRYEKEISMPKVFYINIKEPKSLDDDDLYSCFEYIHSIHSYIKQKQK